MPKKVLISFLGKNKYIECNYIYEDFKKERVIFVQEAIIELLRERENFSDNDVVKVFVTKEAKKHNLDKLLSRLKNTTIEPVDIPEGKNEAEIWTIFDKLYDSINEKDQIFLDITHSFRYIPMLSLIFLNFAQATKEIEIKDIYYGAFEVLGSPKEIEKMPIENRNAPIFNLTPFITLQRYSIATSNFKKYGNPLELVDLFKEKALPSQLSKRRKNIAHSEVSSSLQHIWEYIHTVRGTDLRAGKEFSELNKNLKKLTKDAAYSSRMMNELFNNIKNEFSNFKKNSIHNLIEVIGFCIKHDLTQQGITLARETFISLVLEKMGLKETSNSEVLSWYKKKCPDTETSDVSLRNIRELVSSVCSKKTGEIKGKIDTPLCENLIREIEEATDDWCEGFIKIKELRNDINHAGIIYNSSTDRIKKELRKFYENLKEMAKQIQKEGD